MTTTAPRPPIVSAAPSIPYRVVIVGAGFGGLTMAAQLRAAGVDDFVILEEGPDVGGVWRENTYPGCRCDVPSHLYSFAFDPYRDAALRFPGQAAILAYIREVAERHGLTERLRTGVAVACAEYGDSSGMWTITTTDGQRLRAEAVVWAVGQLHRPATPDFTGLDTFDGHQFHSARWNHDVELTGEVAVIGTGASATQIVAKIARTAARVTVYQRSPAWILPRPGERFGPITRLALERVPGLHRLYRRGLHHSADLVLAPIMRGGWSAGPAQWIARAHLRSRVADPVLRAKLTPDYRIGEKRILFDNDYYTALTRPNVELVTDPVDHITAEGIHTTTGDFRSAQAIVLATGFRATQFLDGITVRGRAGLDLHTQWAHGGGPHAYFGLAVPGFPNMFMVAGPNSFTAANSNPSIKAAQARFIVRCLDYGARLRAPIEVDASAMAAYRRLLDDALAATVWWGGTRTWFTRPDGAITNPWPGSVRAFDRTTARSHPEVDFAPVPVGQNSASHLAPELAGARP